jgi:hypothetical protein
LRRIAGACEPMSFVASTSHHGLKTAPRGEDFNSLKSRSMDCLMAPFVPYNKKLRTRKSPSEMEEMPAKSRGAWHNDLHKLFRFPCGKGYCDFRWLGLATRR